MKQLLRSNWVFGLILLVMFVALPLLPGKVTINLWSYLLLVVVVIVQSVLSLRSGNSYRTVIRNRGRDWEEAVKALANAGEIIAQQSHAMMAMSKALGAAQDVLRHYAQDEDHAATYAAHAQETVALQGALVAALHAPCKADLCAMDRPHECPAVHG